MKYIFPRQFGLHDPFTSTVDRKETVHPFKDYSLREKEISEALKKNPRTKTTYLPRRLRGKAFELVRRMHKRHKSCSYTELLRHYCSLEVRNLLSRSGPTWLIRLGFKSREACRPGGGAAFFCSIDHPASTSRAYPSQDERSADSKTRKKRPSPSVNLRVCDAICERVFLLPGRGSSIASSRCFRPGAGWIG